MEHWAKIGQSRTNCSSWSKVIFPNFEKFKGNIYCGKKLSKFWADISG